MLGIVSPLLSQVPGVSHRFFERIGGTSPSPYRSLNTSHDVSDAPARVDENLARVRFQIGVGPHALYTCTQVHGREVVELLGSEDVADVRARKADALVTCAKDLGVGVRTADCAPVLLAVDDGSAVAAAHAGWRGAVGGVVEAAVERLCAQSGARPERIVAAVGPTIGLASFEVGDDVLHAAAAVVPLDGLTQPGADGSRMHLDLVGLVLRVLRKAGVERAERVGGDTFADDERYFSHRRDVTKRGQPETGRQLSVIARTNPPNVDDEMFR
jgi:hypothetical protein